MPPGTAGRSMQNEPRLRVNTLFRIPRYASPIAWERLLSYSLS